MKKISASLLLLFIVAVAQAQTSSTAKRAITVDPSHELIDQVKREGMQVSIELDAKMVSKLWEKKLKEFGKLEIEQGYYIVRGAVIPNVYSGCTIYSKVTAGTKGTVVFWAIDMGNAYIIKGHTHYSAAETKLSEFARQAYIEDINIQIAAAENALNASVKNQQKISREGEMLKKGIEQNQQEKIDLQNKLKLNADQLMQLNADTEKNKVNQQLSAEEVAKMQKALEVIKQRLNQY